MAMKFKAHQSFFIRKGWLSKGLFAVRECPDIFMPSNSKDAMDLLGLGSNQVVALRYWLKAVGLIEDETKPKRCHKLSELGELVFERDPYVEEVGTLWALHCELSSQEEEATSWYWFFNEFKMSTFTKTDFTDGIQKHISLSESSDLNQSKGRATSSVESDFECIVNTYIPHDRLGGKKVSPENVIDCPLGELGILDVENRRLKTFRKRSANESSLPGLLVVYSIKKMLEKRPQESAVGVSQEIPIDVLLNGHFSPGRTFNLDSVSLLTKLYELENDGYLRINRTAGSDVVRLLRDDMSKVDCLKAYYDLIG